MGYDWINRFILPDLIAYTMSNIIHDSMDLKVAAPLALFWLLGKV